jgi:hypothetical protein
LDSCWALKTGYKKATGKCPIRLVENLWAILKEYRKTAGKCPNILRQPIGGEAELPSS